MLEGVPKGEKKISYKDCFKKIIQSYGARGLLRSYLIVLGIGFQYPLSLCFSQFMIHLSKKELKMIDNFQIGAMSRFMCGLMFYPLYTLRTQMQMKHSNQSILIIIRILS